MNVELEPRVTVADPKPPPREGDVVELSLLLPAGQLMALESFASDKGLTTGQVLRRLITAFLHEPA